MTCGGRRVGVSSSRSTRTLRTEGRCQSRFVWTPVAHCDHLPGLRARPLISADGFFCASDRAEGGPVSSSGGSHDEEPHKQDVAAFRVCRVHTYKKPHLTASPQREQWNQQTHNYYRISTTDTLECLHPRYDFLHTGVKFSVLTNADGPGSSVLSQNMGSWWQTREGRRRPNYSSLPRSLCHQRSIAHDHFSNQ